MSLMCLPSVYYACTCVYDASTSVCGSLHDASTMCVSVCMGVYDASTSVYDVCTSACV